MAKNINRRRFLKKSVLGSAGAALGFKFEEKALLAHQAGKGKTEVVDSTPGNMPMGKLGDLKVSRLICGGNLLSGNAHDRDLLYVSELMKNYFTDEKVMETFEICEEVGINTVLTRVDDHCIRILNKYWNERGGNLQWIAQVKPNKNDLTSDTQRAVDNGAAAVYIQGAVTDRWVKWNHFDRIVKAFEFIKEKKVVSGIGAHMIEVVMECEKAGLEPDFYMKTINSKNYWSAGPMPRHDSVWAETPEKTIEFMQGVKKPWVGFKVLGAGAIHPSEGFKYAFENGTDFICVGMFDFQVREDVMIAKKILSEKIGRERAWRG